MGYESIFRADLFGDQTALITGGGTGIGRCLAHELASLGCHVVIAGRREEPLQSTVAEIEAVGGAASWATLNIRDEEAVKATIEQLVEKHGKIDHLINNAGGQFISPAEHIRAKGWRAVIDTNLNGTFFVSQAVYSASMRDHGGAIVNVIAEMRNGFPGMAHTGAARAGVDNLTKTLAVEWARQGVRVNAIAPGNILSSGMTTYPEAVLKMALPMMRGNPSARMGTEAEISAAITFLLSPASAFTTGETMWVDGGSSLCKVPMIPLEKHEASVPYNGFHLQTALPDFLKD
jgi:citronellol/citronellal dehydrogenase